eukprot:1159228-Pelagomonas_calceolata.AAC.1
MQSFTDVCAVAWGGPGACLEALGQSSVNSANRLLAKHSQFYHGPHTESHETPSSASFSFSTIICTMRACLCAANCEGITWSSLLPFLHGYPGQLAKVCMVELTIIGPSKNNRQHHRLFRLDCLLIAASFTQRQRGNKLFGPLTLG